MNCKVQDIETNKIYYVECENIRSKFVVIKIKGFIGKVLDSFDNLNDAIFERNKWNRELYKVCKVIDKGNRNV